MQIRRQVLPYVTHVYGIAAGLLQMLLKLQIVLFLKLLLVVDCDGDAAVVQGVAVVCSVAAGAAVRKLLLLMHVSCYCWNIYFS